LAVLWVGLAAAVRLWLGPILPRAAAWAIFPAAVAAAGSMAGVAPGLAATALGIPLAWLFGDRAGVLILALAGTCLSFLAGRWPGWRKLAAWAARPVRDRSHVRRLALLGGACLLLLGLCRLLVSDFEREREGQRWAAHTYEVLDATRTLFSTLEDAETAARGYLLTGTDRYLAQYRAAVGAEPAARQALGRLTSGNAAQRSRLEALDGLIAARLERLAAGIRTRQTGGAEAAATVHGGEGAAYMERIRGALQAAEAEDRARLVQRAAAAEAEGSRMRWILGIGAGSLLALLAIAGAVIERDIRSREKDRQAIAEQHEALARSENAAHALLEAANKEMAAFAYSVSHDLRAPLRGIDGWSRALAEDCGEQLDGRAREYLGRVRAETARLEGLIEEMLRLFRITQAEMNRNAVDLTALANAVASRLRERSPERDLDFAIASGLTASGDAGLLEIALTNLLDNAVKFTGPRRHARIEFGRQDCPPEEIFYVRDNGVGFDMAYAGMLFGAFQRLHKASEFPGAGIGLATTQRVIRRHGGRIWADAQPEKGAAFYFTIGGKA
jgi:signal transduction histidine kinase